MARRDDAPAAESENPLAKRRNQALLDKIMNRDSQPQPLARRGWRRVKGNDTDSSAAPASED